MIGWALGGSVTDGTKSFIMMENALLDQLLSSQEEGVSIFLLQSINLLWEVWLSSVANVSPIKALSMLANN